MWPRPRSLYIHFRGLLFPDEILPRAKFTLRPSPCVLLYWQRYCTALQQRASAKLCGVVQEMELRNFCRGRHLYSAGRPSRWASAHILVFSFIFTVMVRAVWRFSIVVALFSRSAKLLYVGPVSTGIDGVIWRANHLGK